MIAKGRRSVDPFFSMVDGIQSLAEMESLPFSVREIVMSVRGMAMMVVMAMATGVRADELAAANTLDQLGGRITRDANLPGNPVVDVDLAGTRITDLWLRLLPELERVQSLNLEGTRITDAGMKELRRLTELQSLNISRTRITDAGLKELTGLKNLRTLDLDVTDVSDAGLKELKALRGLQLLRLNSTWTSEVGLKALQAALPQCKIIR
jgi:hypothetical protein